MAYLRKQIYFDENVKEFVGTTKELALSLKTAIDLYSTQYKIESRALSDLVFYYIKEFPTLWKTGPTRRKEDEPGEILSFTILFVLGKKRSNILRAVISGLEKRGLIEGPERLLEGEPIAVKEKPVPPAEPTND